MDDIIDLSSPPHPCDRPAKKRRRAPHPALEEDVVDLSLSHGSGRSAELTGSPEDIKGFNPYDVHAGGHHADRDVELIEERRPRDMASLLT